MYEYAFRIAPSAPPNLLSFAPFLLFAIVPWLGFAALCARSDLITAPTLGSARQTPHSTAASR